METIVSHILYLDKDFNPIETRVIRRPGIQDHMSRIDHKRIMAVGVGAYKDGDFDRMPCYWAYFNGDLENFENTTIGTRPVHAVDVSKYIEEKIRFIACNDVDKKVKSVLRIFGVYNITPADIPYSGNDPNYACISLAETSDLFTISSLLRSCKIYIQECAESIRIIRRKISSLQNRVKFIDNQQRIIKQPGVRIIEIGKDGWTDTKQLNDWVYKPAKKVVVDELHELKKRMRDLERKRSSVQVLVKQYIFGSLWYTPVD